MRAHTPVPPPLPSRPRMSRTLPGTAKPKTTPQAPPQQTAMRSRQGRHTTNRRKQDGRHRHKPHPHNPTQPPPRPASTQWYPHGCGTPQKLPQPADQGPRRDAPRRHHGRPTHSEAPAPAASRWPTRDPPHARAQSPPPHHGNDTPLPHTSTHQQRAPHRGHNTPEMS